VGTRALEIAKRFNINVCAIAGGKNYELMEKQAREFKPKIISMHDEKAALKLKENLKDTFIKIVSSEDGILEVASFKDSDMVLNAVGGISGLRPTIEAIHFGKNISIANKESIVAAGEIIKKAANDKGVKILPVDSEHSAIFQCLECSRKKGDLKRVFLTASGGPFYGKSREDLRRVSIEETLAHPNWKMGKKITVDSASFMNKGLELIEASCLFEIPFQSIEILVHKESIIHSMVQYRDNSIIAQMSSIDMGLPIQHAILWPDRLDSDVVELDFVKLKSLSFAKFDEEVFELPSVCKKAIELGGTAPAFLVGADEKAVELFLDSKISFLEMMDLIKSVFSLYEFHEINSLDDALDANYKAQDLVLENFLKTSLQSK
jgi:1-deoxy-D-xylulose-5-phosphate reductoisomerase